MAMGIDQKDESHRRIVIAQPPGDASVLRIVRRPLAPPTPHHVRIRVSACGVNRPDILEREGAYPPPKDAAEGLGLEVSGSVDAIGPGVTQWQIGDQVCALLSGGGYGDHAIAHESHIFPAPKSLPLPHAAALPETAMTVWANVFEAGKLAPGERLVVHGGTSGIGVMAIQMAKAHGAEVITTSRSDEKCARCKDMGADHVINSSRQDMVDCVRSLGGADLVLDMVGGDTIQKNLSLLRTDGRLVHIAFAAGAKAHLDLTRLMLKRLTITGSVLRSRSVAEKAALVEAVKRVVWPWIEAGHVAPVIDSEFPLHNVAAAHERLQSGQHCGKILLIP